MGLRRGLVDLVFAPRCLACAGAAEPGRLVCGRCRSRLVPPPPPLCPRCGFPRLRTGRVHGPTCPECADWPVGLRVARSACLHTDTAGALVHQLKYRGWHRVATVLADRMAAIPLPSDVRREARWIVPVPTTRSRIRQRGYNQAEVLARALAERTGLELLPALRRGGAGRSQTALQPAARRANVAGAFGVIAGAERRLGAEHLLLVDDVLTTGATITACAETLIDAGARCVSVLTFARATGRIRLE